MELHHMDVSVVIPTYNRASMLSDTLHSVLSQTLLPREVVVVDDGSDDDTKDIVEAHGPLVQYTRIPNSGPSVARNVGVAKSTSRFVAFCDSDDLWRSDKLERQLALIAAHPDIEYCFTNFSFLRDDSWTVWSKFDDMPQGYWPARTQSTPLGLIVREPLYGALLKWQPIFAGSTVMISRRLFYAIGAFDERFTRTATEDFEFTLRCAEHQPIGIVLEPLVAVRIHEHKHSGDSLANALGQLAILTHAIESHATAKSHISVIEERCTVARLEAVHGAFRRGEFELLQRLFSELSYSAPAMRDWIKWFIAKQPRPIRTLLWSLTLRS